jgi:predicted SAM-dependent methyltransferase
MMFNVNIGGTKGWDKVSESVRKNWYVLDVAGRPDYKYDLNSGHFLPFKNNVVDNYYTSHTLEHILPCKIEVVLSEIYRTLKPDGLIRVVVPDAALAIRRYVEGDSKWLMQRQEGARKRHGYPETSLGRLMLWFYSEPKGTTRSGHRIVFDWETLQWYFEKAGFRNITRLKYSECSEVFKGLDFSRHAKVSLYLEAQK